jgi:hypothetical protein
MKSLAMIFGAIMLCFLLPTTAAGINDFRARDYVEPHIVVTASETSKDIVLTQALFSSATANVIITSNNTNDAPVPFSYVSATKTLTIAGLSANESHNLSITYKIDNLTDDFGASLGSKILLTVLILGIFGLIGGAVYSGTRRSED